MKKIRFVFLALTAVALATSSASAQSANGGRAGIARTNLVSSNPVGLLFEWYNGEFEHAFNSTTSLAIAASSFGDFDDGEFSSGERYSVIDGIARYYPSGRALRGFSIGASAGVVDFSDDYDECFGEYCGEDESGTFATIGVRADYIWILGRDQRFAVAAGLGAKRVFGDSGPGGLPIGRLSIGYAW